MGVVILPPNKNKKKIKIPLDKHPILWYNSIKEREKEGTYNDVLSKDDDQQRRRIQCSS